MKLQYRCAALFLAFLLAFQPAANAFSICKYADQSGPSEHATHVTDDRHALHHHAMDHDGMKHQQSACLSLCDCTGMCPHACHITSLPAPINIVLPDIHKAGYLPAHSISFPGYTFHLLRPPAGVI